MNLAVNILGGWSSKWRRQYYVIVKSMGFAVGLPGFKFYSVSDLLYQLRPIAQTFICKP